MKLIFYSGTHTKELNNYIFKNIPKKKPVFTIIPSSSIGKKSEQFKKKIIAEFENYGFQVNYYPVDIGIFNKEYYTISDVIYLSGWNTQIFLSNLYANWDIPYLKEFAKSEWKILSWLSAWAIIMTPHIKIDNYAHWIWLWLVDYEFYPHYGENLESISDNEFINRYIKKSNNKIYAVPEKSGIIFDKYGIKMVWEGITVFNW